MPHNSISRIIGINSGSFLKLQKERFDSFDPKFITFKNLINAILFVQEAKMTKL